MSLRSRLLLVVLGLVIIGLTATDFVTYRALRSFLLDRVDQQLVAARSPVAIQLLGRRGSTEPVSDALIPAGTYSAIIDTEGKIARSRLFTYPDQVMPDPVLPKLDDTDLSRNSVFGVGSTRGSKTYRAQISALDGEGNRLLVAIPLGDVTQTLHRLLFIEALASGLIVVLVGGAALVLVRAGLRPLEDIGDVAGAIAEGDLSKRVPRAEERTEVGRLGLSLNAMLGQIQSAFEARQASEDRLRRFVADASHELRTPLTSIRGYAELFRRGAAERPADLEKAMRRIEEESVRMGVLVDDLLLLARLDQGRPLDRAPVDLVRVAVDAVDDARAVSPDRSITIDAPTSVVIEGDELRLRQVAANLLANACQHTPPDAPVVVRVTTGAGDNDTVGPIGPLSGEAVLEVADSGPGLDPAAAQKVFERFYRADPSRTRSAGGSGLGLSIVAAIAEAHGGGATVDSTPGKGATFRVVLPLTGRSDQSRAVDGFPASPSTKAIAEPAPTEAPSTGSIPEGPPSEPPTPELPAPDSVPVVSSWAAPPPPQPPTPNAALDTADHAAPDTADQVGPG